MGHRSRWARWELIAVAVSSACLAACSQNLPTGAGAVTPATVTAPAATTPAGSMTLGALAARAVSADPAESAPAIAALRASGPAGLEALFALGQEPGLTSGPELDRLRAAMERVARQRDAYASRLYWYTDLAQATREAKSRGKPILSLRLLGNLDDELSCANSRFFRTALYPNAEVSRRLRQDFVLHWSSERPAPKITIDFGDGRKIERTITGNSIHYVLDAEGRPIDAIPGLYGPAAFLRALDATIPLAIQSASLDPNARREALRMYHADRRLALQTDWTNLLVSVGAIPAPLPDPRGSTSATPTAAAAAPIAMTKAFVEVPMVQAIVGQVTALPSPVNGPAWETLIARYVKEARLDASSRALMHRKIASDFDPLGRVRIPLEEAIFERRVAAFERAIAEDTVHNEYTLHRTVHEWMAMTPAVESLKELNERIYAQLFLTPRTDPWLGLLGVDAYSGIENEGVKLAPKERSAAAPR